MAGYNIVLNEGDNADLVINWADYNGAAFEATGWYKIVDVNTDTVVQEIVNFPACYEITIPLTKAVVKIVTEGNILEKKLILASITYSTSKHKSMEYDFYVRKLDFIAEDGVV